MDNSKIQTLDDLMTYDKMSDFNISSELFQIRVNNHLFIDNLIYDKYKSILYLYCQKIVLTDTEWARYSYKPELLSDDLYDTPNLWHLILFLNNCAVYEFTNRPLILLPPSNITDVFQQILIHEQIRYQRNQQNMMNSTTISD